MPEMRLSGQLARSVLHACAARQSTWFCDYPTRPSAGHARNIFHRMIACWTFHKYQWRSTNFSAALMILIEGHSAR